jgi:hypothetical protein
MSFTLSYNNPIVTEDLGVDSARERHVAPSRATNVPCELFHQSGASIV